MRFVSLRSLNVRWPNCSRDMFHVKHPEGGFVSLRSLDVQGEVVRFVLLRSLNDRWVVSLSGR